MALSVNIMGEQCEGECSVMRVTREARPAHDSVGEQVFLDLLCPIPCPPDPWRDLPGSSPGLV